MTTKLSMTLTPLIEERIKTSNGEITIDWLLDGEDVIVKLVSRGAAGDCMRVGGHDVWFSVCTKDGEIWSTTKSGGGVRVVDLASQINVMSGGEKTRETVEEVVKVLKEVVFEMLSGSRPIVARVIYWVREHEEAKWRLGITKGFIKGDKDGSVTAERLRDRAREDEEIMRYAKNRARELIIDNERVRAGLLKHNDKCVRVFVIGVLGELKTSMAMKGI